MPTTWSTSTTTSTGGRWSCSECDGNVSMVNVSYIEDERGARIESYLLEPCGHNAVSRWVPDDPEV